MEAFAYNVIMTEPVLWNQTGIPDEPEPIQSVLPRSFLCPVFLSLLIWYIRRLVQGMYLDQEAEETSRNADIELWIFPI